MNNSTLFCGGLRGDLGQCKLVVFSILQGRSNELRVFSDGCCLRSSSVSHVVNVTPNGNP